MSVTDLARPDSNLAQTADREGGGLKGVYKRICDNSCNGVITTFHYQILNRNKKRQPCQDWERERRKIFPRNNSELNVLSEINHISSLLFSSILLEINQSKKTDILINVCSHLYSFLALVLIYLIFVYLTSNIFRLETDLVATVFFLLRWFKKNLQEIS